MNNASAMSVRIVVGAIAALTLMLSASAEVRPFPPSFHTEDIKTDGATIHARVGGKGPAVVMLHGFGDTGDMWAPLAEALVKDHTPSFPTCGAWACRPILTPGTTRKRRHSTLLA
jgi:hypothetical protein